MNKGKKGFYSNNYYRNDYGYELKRDGKNGYYYNDENNLYEKYNDKYHKYDESQRKNTYNSNKNDYNHHGKKSLYEDYNQIKYHNPTMQKVVSELSPVSKYDTKKTSNDSSNSTVITQNNSFQNESPIKDHELSSLCFLNCGKFEIKLIQNHFLLFRESIVTVRNF